MALQNNKEIKKYIVKLVECHTKADVEKQMEAELNRHPGYEVDTINFTVKDENEAKIAVGIRYIALLTLRKSN